MRRVMLVLSVGAVIVLCATVAYASCWCIFNIDCQSRMSEGSANMMYSSVTRAPNDPGYLSVEA